MKLNSLSDLLKGFKPHEPALPPKRTPQPERNKVVAIPTRQPINRQAGLIVSPMRCWLSQPLPPEKLPSRESKEVEAIKADLKIERNDHARTRDELGNTRLKLAAIRLELQKTRALLDKLRAECAEKDSVIRQLEDLRL